MTYLKKGFTVVELLIVVTVIAILAAITIVGYNGIQNNAKAAAAQSASSQAAKRLSQYSLENSNAYPTNQAAFNALNIDIEDASYQYVANNSANPPTYCLTATVQNRSYYINNTDQTSAAPGGCDGHGRDGVPPITNIALSPRAVAANALYLNNGAIHALTRNVTVPATPDGITTAAESRILTGITNNSVVSVYNIDGLLNTANKVRSISAWVRVNTTGYESPAAANFPRVVLPANQWVRISTSVPFGATAHSGLWISKTTGNAAETDRGWVTGIMSVEGNKNYPYSDGNSTNWIWNGTVNNSSSTGPAL